MKYRRLSIILSSVLILLFVPLIAMQFTSEVEWKISDFLMMGSLLFGAAFLIEFVMRKVKSIKKRIILFGIILFTFFLIWIELAVGIFGTSWAGS